MDGEGYPEFAREAFHLVVHGAASRAVRLDGSEVTATGGRFVLPNTGTGFALDFAL